ncbi:MAG: ribbon-helix-helix domain-containing protein [Nanobdellota archaeon]
MEVTPIRMPEGLLNETQKLIDKDYYSSKSEAVRDALRKLILEYQIGSVPNTNDSLKEVRDARKELSKQINSFKDIEKLNKL